MSCSIHSICCYTLFLHVFHHLVNSFAVIIDTVKLCHTYSSHYRYEVAFEVNYATYVEVTIDTGCVLGKLCHICRKVFSVKSN